MAKKVLEIKDFTGGLNCYSDPRDIEPNAFAQNWNANVSQSGIIKLGGSLFESIRNLPHDNTNQQMGYGLFTTGVDHAISIIDGEFENGYEEGAITGYAAGPPATITLAATSTHVAFGDHASNDFYNNCMIVIYKSADGGTPEGDTRRIVDYVGSSKVATLDSPLSAAPETDGTEYYRIYRWVGDGVNFGNASGIDYVDKVEISTGSWNDEIEGFNSFTNYFLRTKTSTVVDEQSQDLGFITYNPKTDVAYATADTDSTTIGNTTLESGVEYILSFFCRASSRYYGYVSDGGNVLTSTSVVSNEGTISATVSSETMTVDGISATDGLLLNKHIYNSSGVSIGTCTAVTNTTTIVFGGGINIDVAEDTVLYIYPSGIVTTGVVSNESTESASTSEVTLTVDTTTATDALFLNRKVYKADSTFIGVCTSVTSGTVIVFGSGTHVDIPDNTELFTEGHGERVPFVQLYSDSVTDGTNTGLYLFQGINSPTFMRGIDSTYNYADLITTNYVDNGDFEHGSATGGDGGYNSTYDPPTSWMAYDGFTHDTNHVITYSYIGSSQFGGDGATLKMAPGSGFNWSTNTVGNIPECYMYQDLTLNDNQWYELFFAYSSDSDGVAYAITDIGDLTSTGIKVNEPSATESAADGAVTVTVDTTDATDALVKNREIYKSDGTFLGVCHTVSNTTTIVFTAGTAADIIDNTILYTAKMITPWKSLIHTGGVTTYKYIDETNGFPRPHKFFVPPSSTPGTDKKIRISFAPMVQGTDVRFDGITVRKSFPDLLSMGYKAKIGNPYNTDIEDWHRYQLKFKIPSEFNNATDWVLRLHGGTWGCQTGAAGTATTQTVYFDRIRLEATKNDNLIFLNDNTSTNSKINIYSSNSGNWIENDLIWDGLKMQPVYNYINGVLKISDANFESGNTNKIFYFLNKKHLAGETEILGYRVRDSAISFPPPLIVHDNGVGEIMAQTFDALHYCESETFGIMEDASTPMKQWELSGDSYTTTNWPVNDLENVGRVMYYFGDDNTGDDSGHPTLQLYSNPTLQFTTVYWNDGGGHFNPFYLAWAGQDGSNDDMGGKMDGVTTGSVAKVEFEFTYCFTSYSHDGSNNVPVEHQLHPQFQVRIGKANTTISNYLDGSPSDLEKKKILTGHSTINFNTNAHIADFYVDDLPWNMTEDEENSTKWEDSVNWPYGDSVYHHGAGDGASNVRNGSKTFKGVVTFNEDLIVITDDMLMEFEVIYPNISGDNNLFRCIKYRRGDNSSPDTHATYDFARKEQVKFSNINVSFYNNNWDPENDGVTTANVDDTKVTYKWATPSGQTGVGWEERVFKLAVSSVNIFDEESHLSKSDTTIGGSTTAGSQTDVSILTAGQCPDVTIYVGDNVANDYYRKKLKFYMQDTESNIWYLQFYVDLEKNKAYSTTSNYSTYGINDTTNKTYSYSIPKEKLLNYNEVDSYESQTLIPQEIAEKGTQELECNYKASVVANNRLYVGNIRQNGKVYGDRIIKSPIGKYNLLPSSNFIDVAINDGDEITALAFYKDKLLQFKKKKVFVLNTSGDYEFLEDTFDNVGVIGQYQVTSTPYGIAWINSSGCHVYDGKALTNLIDNKIPENSDDAIILQNLWNITETPYNSGAISYNAGTKDLVIKTQLGGLGGDGHSSGNTTGTTSNSIPDGYVYNLPTKSWYFTNNGFAPRWGRNATGVTSNFAINEDGNIIVYAKDTGTASYGHRVNDILKWDSSKGNDETILDQRAITSLDNRRPFIFKTADLSFGDITARKKIYKVYVTYKSVDSSGDSANSSVLVKHATNGGTTYTAFDDSSTNYAAATGLTGSEDWATAILKPTSSINNIYSFQLEFSAALGAAVGFQINDISVVYRVKPVK